MARGSATANAPWPVVLPLITVPAGCVEAGHRVLCESVQVARIGNRLAAAVRTGDRLGGASHATMRNSFECFAGPAWRGSATA
jgi:hypothetical protein